MLTIREVIKTLYNALLQRLKKHRGNWEQNDPTADDYIKNRPFYTDESKKETVVKAKTFTATSSYWWGSPFAFIPIVGETYKVTFDDKEYICQCKVQGDAKYIGNAAIDWDGPDTGEPFFYFWYDKYEYGMCVRYAGKHTITVEKLEIIKIDKRYLPDNNNAEVEAAIDDLYDYANYLDGTISNIPTDTVRYNNSQNLSASQKKIARNNIGLPFGEEGVTEFINYTAFLGTPTTAYEHNWVSTSTTAEANGYLEEGEIYIVTWAGTEYVCTAYRGNSPSGQYSDVLKIGNNFIGASPGIDTGEPFVMWQLAPARNLQIGANATYANQNIVYTVAKVELSKVPELWIPNTIARVSELLQSDWNQNNSAQTDYIKNRTHYEELIVGETLYEGSALREVSSLVYSALSAGDEVVFIANGVEYVGVPSRYNALSGDTYWYIGNLNLHLSATDTGEDYLFSCRKHARQGTFAYLINAYINDAEYTGDITVKYPDNVVLHTLDEKFIPSTIARTEDIPSVEGLATEDYVDNKISELGGGGVIDDHINSLIDAKLDTFDTPEELPTVTADNNGAFLRVVNGAWAVAILPNAEEASF